MEMNQNKCKIIISNTHKKYVGTPKLTLSGEGADYLKVGENVKLLSLKLRSDLRCCDNTDYIHIYQKQVRSVLELAVSVWQTSITMQEIKQTSWC